MISILKGYTKNEKKKKQKQNILSFNPAKCDDIVERLKHIAPTLTTKLSNTNKWERPRVSNSRSPVGLFE